MAFNPDPYAMLVAAKEKARVASDTFSDAPRYDAAEIWGRNAAARTSNPVNTYGSGAPSINSMVVRKATMPQDSSEEENALYTQAGSNAVRGMMDSGLSAMPQNFATLKGITDQSIDAASALKHQQAMNELEIAKSKIGGGSPLSAVLGGVSQLASFGSGQGWFGGGSTASSVPAGGSFFSASNPVTFSSGFGSFG